MQEALEFYSMRDEIAISIQKRGNGRWGGDTYDFVAGIIGIKVDSDNVHGCISRRSGDNDLLGSSLKMSRGPKT